MKTEHLESLLLDRALGQLGPEVADLLDEHLARDPEAALRSASLSSTVRLARESVALHAHDAERISARGFAAAHHGVWWSKTGREAVKIAACLAVGLGIGWAVRSHAVQRDQFRHAETVRAMPSDLPTPASNFWSRERWESGPPRAPRRRPPLAWPMAPSQRQEDKL